MKKCKCARCGHITLTTPKDWGFRCEDCEFLNYSCTFEDDEE